VLVKEALWAMGVPVAYMQLDDWWYQGPFYFGNVKSVRDWHASNSSGLFPHGLPAFSDRLALPLQLYTPFFSNDYESKYNMTESTKFKGTKIVVPKDSYAFFADLFDLGLQITNGRFSTYEVDFLDANFAGCAACMENVEAADLWYAGMANAAAERNITIQYCLPSATDMLASLAYPAVVQARASGDYARPEGNTQPWGNVVTLGGASLLLGATHVAPSKDTLWTKSPQPPTSSDRTHSGYKTQPHVALDAVLATLSLGPVGISDGLNQTDACLIGQAFRSGRDSTLLRPSRPLSTVDSVFTNKTLGVPAADVRSTHAALPKGGANSHYFVAWMTTSPVSLRRTDLYPPPPPLPPSPSHHRLNTSGGVSTITATAAPVPPGQRGLAVRRHRLESEDFFDGCVDGAPASPGCVELLPPGVLPTLPAVGGTIADFSLTAVYEPQGNGAYFLGELSKFVHVSPQRFEAVVVGGDGPCGLKVNIITGSNGRRSEVATAEVEKGIEIEEEGGGGLGRRSKSKGRGGGRGVEEKIYLAAVDRNGTVHLKTVTIPSCGDFSLLCGTIEVKL